MSDRISDKVSWSKSRNIAFAKFKQDAVLQTFFHIGWGALVALIFLLLVQYPVHAATINVNGQTCTLENAIHAANSDKPIAGCIAGVGTDTLVLSVDTTLTKVLPSIDSTVILEGNGHTIDGNNQFTVLAVTASGNLTLSQLTISGGKAANGGGIYNDGGTITIANSLITGNTADAIGGGIYTTGTLTLTNSSIRGNSAGTGGGIDNVDGELNISNSTISGNQAITADGGGISNNGSISMTNSTLSGNSAKINGGGVYNDTDSVTMLHVTVFGNSAATGGGVYNDEGIMTLTHTLVVGNKASDNGAAAEIENTGTINANNFNLFAHAGLSNDKAFVAFSPGTNDITATSDGTKPASLNTILDTTLSYNGGFTQTHALPMGSPAMDAITGQCPPADVDQRNEIRPQGQFCDIGAYELRQNPPHCFGRTATKSGTKGDDILTGTNGPDVIHGLGGNDIIKGLRGNDIICGGVGDDILKGGRGSDVLLGGKGKDMCRGGPGSDTAVNCEIVTGIP
jgi:predicted outer membrane repeat protein